MTVVYKNGQKQLSPMSKLRSSCSDELFGGKFFEKLKNCVRTPMKWHFRLPDGNSKEKQII